MADQARVHYARLEMITDFVVVAFMSVLGMIWLRLFRRTGAISELLFGVMAFGIALHFLLMQLQGVAAWASVLALAVGVICWVALALAFALSATVESGIYTEVWRRVAWRIWEIGNVDASARATPPTTTRRSGVVAGAGLILLGVAHQALLPTARLPYSLLFILIGVLVLLLAVLRLR